jgi:hypothetical protein
VIEPIAASASKTSGSTVSANASIDAIRLKELRSILRFNLLAGSILAVCELFLMTRLPEWQPRLFWMITASLVIGMLLFGGSATYLSRLFQKDLDKLLANRKSSQ